jgi:RNA polymerase sigma factor (sigma-70 family)
MIAASSQTVVGFLRRIADQGTGGQTDRELLDRFVLQRDEAAFAELVRRHGPMVLSACRGVLSHEQDAEDAFQAAFLVLASKAGAIRQGSSVAGWLYRVALRLALRARSVRGRQRFAELQDVVAQETSMPQQALDATLAEELGRLPEQYRAVVVLCYLEGRGQAEAALLLATTESAVNSRLKRARDLLRQRLARRGYTLSAAAVAGALTAGTAQATLAPSLVRLTTQAAVQFAAGQAACTASTFALFLARGALSTMSTLKSKALGALVVLLAAALASTGGLFLVAAGETDAPKSAVRSSPRGSAATVVTRKVSKAARRPARQDAPPAAPRAKPKMSCIVLWLSGGPSQLDTFDLKPGHANGGPFKEIGTTAPGVRISEHLPQLAKVGKHLAILRSLTHREGDHTRATYLMQTGHAHDGLTDYPALGCVLAKELGAGRPGLPPYINIGRFPFEAHPGPGFLDEKYGPVLVTGKDLEVPPASAFEKVAKGKGEQLRKAVAGGFDLGQEKAAVRDAYGRDAFGQGCLLARRLVEVDVPVVEVNFGGWDTHANLAGDLPKLCSRLDAALSSLLRELHERKRLETTVVVCMGEFGRTPRINASGGRDHFPAAFSVVLAGGKIKGGQAIGKTSADGVTIEKRPVTPAELLATVYQALGIDPAKTNRTPGGKEIPLVEKGTKAVSEALR